MDLNELAALMQRSYESLRSEMVSRDELRATEATTLRANEGLGAQVSQYAAQLNGDFARLADRVDDISGHLARLETMCKAPP